MNVDFDFDDLDENPWMRPPPDPVTSKKRENEDEAQSSSSEDSENLGQIQRRYPIGYLIMLKMGWRPGQGLGVYNQGRTEPLVLDTQMKTTGLGRIQHLEAVWQSHMEAVRLSIRSGAKPFDEKDAQHLHQKEQLIQEMTSEFYCSLCDKQYLKLQDYELHLSSSDHNSKKRSQEMKSIMSGPALDHEDLLKLERKKEELRLAAMIKSASADSVPVQESITLLPEKRSVIQFSFKPK